MRLRLFPLLAVLLLAACAPASASPALDGPPSEQTVSADPPDAMRATFTGLEAFGGFLDATERRVRDTAPLMRRVAELGRSSTVHRIKRGVTPEGERFAENADSTIAAKGSSKPLVDRADYLGSITTDSGPEHAAWGSNSPQAGALNDGTDRAGRGRSTTIPARKHYGLSDEDSSDIDALAADHVSGR